MFDRKDDAQSKQIKSINTKLLLMRYKDTLPLINDSKKSDLAYMCQAMLLGYGYNHSAHGTGLFADFYNRSMFHFTPAEQKLTGLDGEQTHTLAPIYNKGSENIIPISAPFAKSFFNNDHTSLFGYQAEIKSLSAGDSSLGVVFDKSKQEDYKHILGGMGFTIGKDAQLRQFSEFNSHLEPLITDSFKKRFIVLLNAVNQEITCDNFDEVLKDCKSFDKDEKAKCKLAIIDLLNLTSGQYTDAVKFYLTILNKLIKPLDSNNISNSKREEQSQLAWERLHYIIQEALKNTNNYSIFSTYFEFAVDEINFLLMLHKVYQEDNIKESISSFIKNQLKLKNKPDNIMLNNCGMQIIYSLLANAIKEISPDLESGSIYIQHNNYFQIFCSLDVFFNLKDHGKQFLFLSSPTPIDACVNFKDGEAKLDVYKNQLVDIIVCIPKENVSLNIPGFHSRDIAFYIARQLEMRKDHDKTDRRLIVIMDTTMLPIDDTRLSRLLKMYESEIQNGQLAILTCHSLNKYFHMGADKTPAGLSAMFYNKEKFPVLRAYTESFPLGEFTETDATPKLITHLMKYSDEDISEYYKKVHKGTQFAYQYIIPEKLKCADQKQFISVDSISDSDRNNIRQVWGFINLRCNVNFDKDRREFAYNKIRDVLFAVGIKNRAGFGYSTATHATVGEGFVIRIGVGLESQDLLKKMFTLLSDYLIELNDVIQLNSTMKDQDLISKLTDKYLDLANQLQVSDKIEKQPSPLQDNSMFRSSEETGEFFHTDETRHNKKLRLD